MSKGMGTHASLTNGIHALQAYKGRSSYRTGPEAITVTLEKD